LESINSSSLEWMPKEVWGPIKWRELHYRGLIKLPMDDEWDWFNSFRKGLPCPKCRKHFEMFVQKNPPDLSSRPKFFAWTVAAHNHVNEALHKKTVSVEKARRLHHLPPKSGS
jgi:hypothetical protein